MALRLGRVSYRPVYPVNERNPAWGPGAAGLCLPSCRSIWPRATPASIQLFRQRLLLPIQSLCRKNIRLLCQWYSPMVAPIKPYVSVVLAVVVLGSEAHQVAASIMSHANPVVMPVSVPESEEPCGHDHRRASAAVEPTSVDVSTFAALSNAIASNTAVNVVTDITFTGPITISGLTDLAIGSTNGAVLTSNQTFSPSYSGLFYIAGNSNVTFSGLGFANGLTSNYGGCLYVEGSSNVGVELSNFTNCYAAGSGGAFYLLSSTATVSRSTFSKCTANIGGASGAGGAFYLYSSMVTVSYSTFLMCTAGNGAITGYGGAFYLRSSSTATVSDSTFSKCTAGGNAEMTVSGGGAFYLSSSTATVSNSTFSKCTSGNSNANEVEGGGAFYLSVSTITVSGSSFSKCTAGVGNSNEEGGAFLLSGSKATVSSSTFSKCSAPIGGALSLHDGSTMACTDGTLSLNSADAQGGAGYVDSTSSLALVNFSLASNEAGLAGGAFYLDSGNMVGGSLSLFCDQETTMPIVPSLTVLGQPLAPSDRCIVYNNSALFGDGGAFYLAGPYADLSVQGETTFIVNTAARDGGAVFSVGAPILQADGARLAFVNNQAGTDSASGSGSGGAFYLSFLTSASLGRTFQISLSDTWFDGNSCTQRGGAMLTDLPVGTPKAAMLSCKVCGYDFHGTGECKDIPTNSTWREWDHNASVALTRLNFTNNVARGTGAAGGALSITNGNVTISASSFLNNSATTLGGAIHLPRAEFPEATTQLAVSDTNFTDTGMCSLTLKGSALFSESAASLRFDDTHFSIGATKGAGASAASSNFDVEFGGNITWGANSRLQCPVGYNLVIPTQTAPFPTSPLPEWENSECVSKYGPCSDNFETCYPPMLQQSIAYNCTPCATNSFSLEAGCLEGGVAKSITCLTDCPYGGDCSDGAASVKAQPGFYGARDYAASPPTIRFVACPIGFCCEDSVDLCAWDNTCVGHRTGILCGKCEADFSVSLWTTDCVPTDGCVWWRSVLPLELGKAVAYTALFYFKPASGFASAFSLVAFYDQIFNSLSITGKSDFTVIVAGLSYVLGSSSFTASGGNGGSDGDVENDDSSSTLDGDCAWPGMTPLAKLFIPFMDVLLIFALLFLIWTFGVLRRRLEGARPSGSNEGGIASAIGVFVEAVVGMSQALLALVWRQPRAGDESAAATRQEEGYTRLDISTGADGEAKEEGDLDGFDGGTAITDTHHSNDVEVDDQAQAHDETPSPKGSEADEHESDGGASKNPLTVTAAQALNFSVGALVSTSTLLLACTDSLPEDDLRLIVEGSVSCYTSWQWALMFVVVAIVVVTISPIVSAILNLIYGADRHAPMGRFLMQSEAIQSVAVLAQAPFKPKCWYWLGILMLQRVFLEIVQALATLTATLRALWGVVICSLAFGLQTTFRPFKDEATNAAQALLLFSAVVVAALNVVPAILATNALSTSEKMEHEVDFLVAVEAALLFVPIALVMIWQVYVERGVVSWGISVMSGLVTQRADSGLAEARSGPLESPLLTKPLPNDGSDDGGGLAVEQAENAHRAKSASMGAGPIFAGAEDVGNVENEAPTLGSGGGGAP